MLHPVPRQVALSLGGFSKWSLKSRWLVSCWFPFNCQPTEGQHVREPPHVPFQLTPFVPSSLKRSRQLHDTVMTLIAVYLRRRAQNWDVDKFTTGGSSLLEGSFVWAALKGSQKEHHLLFLEGVTFCHPLRSSWDHLPTGAEFPLCTVGVAFCLADVTFWLPT